MKNIYWPTDLSYHICSRNHTYFRALIHLDFGLSYQAVEKVLFLYDSSKIMSVDIILLLFLQNEEIWDAKICEANTHHLLFW